MVLVSADDQRYTAQHEPAEEQMKAYMAYSRHEGPAEGAVLVIANTAQEARKMAYQAGSCFNVDEWIDQAARLLRDPSAMKLANQSLLDEGKPHIVDNPQGCASCNAWGAGIYDDGVCCNCDNYAGDELVKRLTAV